jgi:hypothetical protein
MHIASEEAEALPSPKECSLIASPDHSPAVRRLTCRRYNACLEVAVERDWVGFSCEDCKVQDLMTREEERLEIDGLAGLLSSMNLASHSARDE